MYPSSSCYVLCAGVCCKFIRAVTFSIILVRTQAMDALYNTMHKLLREVYRGETLEEWRLPREQIIIGASCVVVRHGSVARGEIVSIDEDNDMGEISIYVEVSLVDEGISVFVESHNLFSSHPLAIATPVLSIECTVCGLDLIDTIVSEDIVDWIVQQHDHLTVESVIDERTQLIRFVTPANEDIAELVLAHIGPSEDDDNGYGDEIFSLASRDPEAEREEQEQKERAKKQEAEAEEQRQRERQDRWKQWLKTRRDESSDSDEEIDESLRGATLVDRIVMRKHRHI